MEKNPKPNKAPQKPPQRLVGKNSRPGTHKLIVWNIQQSLKHTAEPSVLILPHCLQISNYGQLSSSSRSLSLCYTFSCFVSWDFWFFRLLTSTVTVDSPGAERKNESVLAPFHTLLRTANPEQKKPWQLYTDSCDR